MSELLLEIGTEEIPAGFIPKALTAMEILLAKMLSDARLSPGKIKAMGNPRRLMLHVEGLSSGQPDMVRVVTGPPKRAAFSADGKPTKAAEGFARGLGVLVDDLKVIETDKGEYVSATVEEKGAEAAEVLSGLLPKFILAIPFPKSMRWADRDIRFARPIHWILALFGGEIVHFELDGIKSGELTRGHRFLSPGVFRVKDFDTYIHQTRDNFTIVDPEARREMVRRQVEQTAASVNAIVLTDDGLLEEVSFLVEYPVAVLGSFDREFLMLPREVLVNSMREHQRYFALTDSHGALMPNFITISNTKAEDMDVVRAGNERVLRARLSDARYFYEHDLKRPLADRVEDLKKVVFQIKLGTTYEKVTRVVKLSEYIAGALYKDEKIIKDASRAAYLCKADLVTGMVYEFPNLQGIMGGEYARKTGENEQVSKAVAEHYYPRFSGDNVPSTPAGTVVSIADKIDTIAGIFSIGKAPTGSEDPYGLRRGALGIISMIYAGGFRISLKRLISEAVSLLKVNNETAASLQDVVLDFFRQRVSGQLTSEGYAYDTVDSVLATYFDDVIDARERVAAISEFRKSEDFPAFITAFKRVANIIPEGFQERLDEGRLIEPAEKDLYYHYKEIRDEVHSSIEAGRYGQALSRIAGIRPFVDKFFDEVMVMDKDEAIKTNRLALMGLLAGMFLHIADIRKIVV
ncbi:MAG: glycine--tRNA ligase subunit beta [Nitrospirota bacterium]